MPSVAVSDDRVATLLADLAAKRCSADVEQLDVLLDTATKVDRLVQRWRCATPLERAGLSAERASLLSRGFALAGRAPSHWSPGLGEAVSAAREVWQRVAQRLGALEARSS